METVQSNKLASAQCAEGETVRNSYLLKVVKGGFGPGLSWETLELSANLRMWGRSPLATQLPATIWGNTDTMSDALSCNGQVYKRTKSYVLPGSQEPKPASQQV